MTHSDASPEKQGDYEHDLYIRQDVGRSRGHGTPDPRRRNPFLPILLREGRWDDIRVADDGRAVHGSRTTNGAAGQPTSAADPAIRVRRNGLETPPPYAQFYKGLAEARQAIGYTEQIVRHWVNVWGIHYLLGAAGVGKTTALVNLGLHLALNKRKWFGWEMTQHYVVAYASGETPALTLDYVEAFCDQHGIAWDDTKRFMLCPEVVDLRKRDDVALLARWLHQTVPAGTKLILIVDTWQRATGGADQKEEEDMAAAVRNAEWLSTQLQGPVIAAIHPPKNNPDTISGTGILWNSSVAVWKLEAEGGDMDALTLTNERMKGPGEGETIHLRRIRPVPIGGKDQWGYPRTSAILKPRKATNDRLALVRKAREEMLAEGLKPSVRQIEERLKGQGHKLGKTQIAELLKQCPQVCTERTAWGGTEHTTSPEERSSGGS